MEQGKIKISTYLQNKFIYLKQSNVSPDTCPGAGTKLSEKLDGQHKEVREDYKGKALAHRE